MTSKSFGTLFYLLLTFVLCLLLVVTRSDGRKSTKDRVLLRDIQTLTLTRGKMTTGSRTRPIPQLQCIGGTARCAFIPQTVQCYNRGSDGVDVQWECKSDLNSNYKFGKIEVICEGHEYPEDDYVLVGSCGLEYTIDLVDPSIKPANAKNYFQVPEPRHVKSDGVSLLYLGLMVAAIALIYFTCLKRSDGDEARPRYMPEPSAPPPPGFRSDRFGDTKPEPEPERRASGGGGFWTGAGLGGMAGYLFGRRNTRPNYTDQSSFFGSRTRYSRDSSEFRDNTPPPQPTTSTYEATGFGGTKRR